VPFVPYVFTPVVSPPPPHAPTTRRARKHDLILRARRVYDWNLLERLAHLHIPEQGIELARHAVVYPVTYSL